MIVIIIKQVAFEVKFADATFCLSAFLDTYVVAFAVSETLQLKCANYPPGNKDLYSFTSKFNEIMLFFFFTFPLIFLLDLDASWSNGT